MNTVTLSSRFQVVIPQEVRAALNLTPGEKFRVLYFDNRVELIPVRTMQQMRGFLRGIDTNIPDDSDRL